MVNIKITVIEYKLFVFPYLRLEKIGGKQKFQLNICSQMKKSNLLLMEWGIDYFWVQNSQDIRWYIMNVLILR